MHFGTRLCGMCTSREIACIPSIRMSPFPVVVFAAPPARLLLRYCSSHIGIWPMSIKSGGVKLWISKSFDFYTVFEHFTGLLEYFRWSVGDGASSVRVALVALLGRGAVSSPCWSESLVWTERWLLRPKGGLEHRLFGALT